MPVKITNWLLAALWPMLRYPVAVFRITETRIVVRTISMTNDRQSPPALLIGYGDSTSGGAMIELMPATEPGPRPSQFTRFQPGLRHVALRVNNFEQAYRKLQAAEVEFITDPGQAVGGGKTVLFRDPEGNELQIVER